MTIKGRRSQSSIRPGDDSDFEDYYVLITAFVGSQSSIRPGDDSDTREQNLNNSTFKRSQSSIRPGDDSDRWRVTEKEIVSSVAIQYSPWR